MILWMRESRGTVRHPVRPHLETYVIFYASVEYTLTAVGESLLPIIAQMVEFGRQYLSVKRIFRRTRRNG